MFPFLSSIPNVKKIESYGIGPLVYLPVMKTQPREIFEGIIIYDLEHKKLRTAIMNPGSSGEFSLMIDVFSCPTNRSKQYFAFQKWKDYTEMSKFQVRDRNTTPNKKQRFNE